MITPEGDMPQHVSSLIADNTTESIRQAEVLLVEEALCNNLDPTMALQYQAIAPYLNYDALVGLLNQRGYLVEIQQNLACLITALFHSIRGYHPINYARQRLRHWLSKGSMQQLGGSSVEGVVFSTSLTTDDDFLAVKVPRHRDYLAHEALIGLYVTNYVKRWVINFPYVYGYTTCSRMVRGAVPEDSDEDVEEESSNSESVDEFRSPSREDVSFQSIGMGQESGEEEEARPVSIINWCTSDNMRQSMLIMEKIKDAEPMSSYLSRNIKDVTVAGISGLFWQVINALAVAGEQCQLTMYDMHAGNVLIRWHEDPVPVQTFYWLGDVQQPMGQIISNNVMYIIDTGVAHARIKGYNFGRTDLAEYGVMAEHRPLFDLNFIILNWSIIIWLNDPNHKALDMFARMYAIWSPVPLLEDLQAMLNKDWSNNDQVDVRRRWSPEYQKYTWPLLWSRMWEVMREEERDFYRPLGGTANVNLAQHISDCQFVELVDVTKTPDDPIVWNDSYQALSALTNGSDLLTGNQYEQITYLMSSFSLDNYLTNSGLAELRGYINSAREWWARIVIPDIHVLNAQQGGVTRFVFTPELSRYYLIQWYNILGAYQVLYSFQTLFSNILDVHRTYSAHEYYKEVTPPLPDAVAKLGKTGEKLWADVRKERRRILQQTRSMEELHPNDAIAQNWIDVQKPYLALTANL